MNIWDWKYAVKDGRCVFLSWSDSQSGHGARGVHLQSSKTIVTKFQDVLFMYPHEFDNYNIPRWVKAPHYMKCFQSTQILKQVKTRPTFLLCHSFDTFHSGNISFELWWRWIISLGSHWMKSSLVSAPSNTSEGRVLLKRSIWAQSTWLKEHNDILIMMMTAFMSH